MAAPGKGRFTINCLSEDERLDIILDIKQKPCKLVDEVMDFQHISEKSESPNSKIARTGSKAEKELIEFENKNEKSCKKFGTYSCEVSLVNDNCLQVFQGLMNSKYIEMINFHKNEMLNYIIKDSERQQTIMEYLEEVTELTRMNHLIEQENIKIKNLILEKAL